MAGSKRKRNNSKRNRKKAKLDISNNNTPHKRNWIETCADSTHRIPSSCVAPIVCEVTRVELEQERLLPVAVKKEECEVVVDVDKIQHESKETIKEEDTVKKDARVEAKPILREPKDQVNAPSGDTISYDEKARQIAPLLKAPDVSGGPFKIPHTIDVNGEQKNVFVPVKRNASAIGPTKVVIKWQLQKKRNKLNNQHQHLPNGDNGDNGDGIPNPHPKHLVPDKFWAQRKRLFSRYDNGIQIGDLEMWYSITPEVIAHHVAKRMIGLVRDSRKSGDVSMNTKREIVILDAFCGCGGNTIAFAKKNNVKVIAVDNDKSRLEMAANNARVYDVNPKNIVFVHADVVDVLTSYREGSKCIDATSFNDSTDKKYTSEYEIGGLELLPKEIDAIFLSPPWGGMGYENNDTFDPVSSIIINSKHVDGELVATNGGELFDMSAKAVFSNSKDGVLVYFLPRNVDGVSLGQIAVASGIDHSCFELEQNVVNGKVKTVTAYFGQCLSQNFD